MAAQKSPSLEALQRELEKHRIGAMLVPGLPQVLAAVEQLLIETNARLAALEARGVLPS